MSLSVLLFVFAIVLVTANSTCISSDGKFNNNSCSYQSNLACANTTYSNGWHLLKLYSCNNTRSFDDVAYSAGILEGYLYKNEIDYAFQNVNASLWGNKDLTPQVQAFVEDQYNYVQNLINNNTNNEISFLKTYFNHKSNKIYKTLSLILKQHQGMYEGYKIAGGLLPFKKFYYLTIFGELLEIEKKLNSDYNLPDYAGKECSVMVKYVNNSLLIAHNTHNIYSLMLRIYKDYSLNLSVDDQKLNNFQFSSRPGDINSKDDYYTLSNNLVVMETSLDYPDKSILSSLNTRTIPKWMRAHLANRLARNGEEWVKLFHFKNSGTHNDQWVIVDINRFNELEEAKTKFSDRSRIVYITDQTPFLDKIYYKDITNVLFNKTWVGSFNKPYFREVYVKGGYLAKNITDYYHDNRFILFSKLHNTIDSISSLQKLIRYHDKSEMCDTICPRCDLVQNWAFGGVDAKVTSSIMIQNTSKRSKIISGPPYIEGISTPFQFSNTQYEKVSHLGIQDRFDNKWIDA